MTSTPRLLELGRAMTQAAAAAARHEAICPVLEDRQCVKCDLLTADLLVAAEAFQGALPAPIANDKSQRLVQVVQAVDSWLEGKRYDGRPDWPLEILAVIEADEPGVDDWWYAVTVQYEEDSWEILFVWQEKDGSWSVTDRTNALDRDHAIFDTFGAACRAIEL